MRFFSLLNGDDIFISYSRHDGSLYAAGLADKLTEKQFSCFIDRLGTPPGNDLPDKLIKKIRSCSVLVIVGTENAARSEFVLQEIREFKKTGRVILPIDFHGNVGRSIWYREIPGLAAETEKSQAALETGDPSPKVIAFIEKSFNYTRRNQYTARLFTFAIAAFVILIGLGTGAFIIAKNEANRERMLAAEARQEAKEARQETEKARHETEGAHRETETALTQARDARETAASATRQAENERNRASTEALRADAKTKLADEKTRAAKAADQQRISAEKETVEQKQQASSALAENYYNIALTEGKTDPLRALPWLEKAIETAPETDGHQSLYKFSALQKTRYSNRSVINTGLLDTPSKTLFSPDLDCVFLEAGDENLILDLKTGEKFPIPVDLIHRGLRLYERALSADGKWASALAGVATSPRQPDEIAIELDLYVWEIDKPGNLTKIGLKDITTKNYPKLTFSPDSGFVIVNFKSERLKKRGLIVWNIFNGREEARLTSDVLLYEKPQQQVESRPTVSDLLRGYRLYFRSIHIPFSENKLANRLITFENKTEETIANVRNIASDCPAIALLQLEKYVDFVGFSGNGERVITVSHNTGNERIFRIWDAQRGSVIKSTSPFEKTIVGVSMTGDMVATVSDNKNELELLRVPTGRTALIRASGENDVLDYFVRFTDDGQHIIVTTDEKTSRLSRGPVYNQRFLTVWETNDEYVLNRVAKMDNIENLGSFSRSNKNAGFLNTDGTVSVRRLVPTNAPLLDRLKISPGPGKDDTTLYSSKDFKAIVTVTEKGGSEHEIDCWDIDLGQKIVKKKDRSQKINAEELGGYYSISPDNKRFAIANGHPFLEPKTAGFYVLDLEKEEESKFIGLGEEVRMADIEFDRTGSRVVSLVTRLDISNHLLIQKWGSSTGKEDAPPIERRSPEDIYKNISKWELTEYGEFIIAGPSETDSPQGNSIFLASTASAQEEVRIFKFKNPSDAKLAARLIDCAEEIKYQGDGLLLKMERELNVEVKKYGNRYTIVNGRTRRRIVAPDTSIRRAHLSPDGRFVVVISSGTSVWSTETGSLITNHIGEGEYDGYAGFTPDGSSVVTVSPKGEISTWLLGFPEKRAPSWLQGLGPAITGLEVDNDLDLVSIPQERLSRIRNEYLSRLRRAADEGDPEARYVLENIIGN